MDKMQHRHTDKWTKYKTDTHINGQNTRHTQVNGRIARQTHK